jgi:hypothetical protein
VKIVTLKATISKIATIYIIKIQRMNCIKRMVNDMNKRIGRFGGVLTCMCVVGMTAASLTAAATAATETESTDANGSLTLICKNDDTVIADVQWRIYRAASPTDDGSVIIDSDFADYDITFDISSTSAAQNTADTLEVYTHTDSIEPIATAQGNSDGEVVFSGLSDGIYLVSGDSVTVDNITYTPSAALIQINSANDDGNVYAYPKFTTETVPSESGSEYSVFKSWSGDEDYPDARPDSVGIDIYFNDEFFESVELNEDNSWTYTWTSDEDGTWLAVETNVPDGYGVTYETSDNQLAVVNTYTPPDDDTPPSEDTTEPEGGTTPNGDDSTPDEEDSTPDDEDSTPDDEDSTPDDEDSTPDDSMPDSTVDSTPDSTPDSTSSQPPTTTTTTTTKNESAPQTGQLWWPVPIMAVVGLLFLALGKRLNNKKESDD